MSSIPPTGSRIVCSQAASWLTVRPDDAAERRLLEAHLGACRACAALAERHAGLDALLRAHLVTAPPPELSQRLAALALAAARERAAARPAARASRRAMGREARLAAYLLAALAVMAFWDVLVRQWLGLLALGAQLAGALQLALTAPAVWLLPMAADALGWLVTALVVVLLVRVAITPSLGARRWDYASARRR